MLSWGLVVIGVDRRNIEAGTESFAVSDEDISVDNLDESPEQRPGEWLSSPNTNKYHLLKTYSVTDECSVTISLLPLPSTTTPPMIARTNRQAVFQYITTAPPILAAAPQLFRYNQPPYIIIRLRVGKLSYNLIRIDILYYGRFIAF